MDLFVALEDLAQSEFDTDQIILLVTSGSTRMKKVDVDGNTPFFLACQNQNIHDVEDVLEVMLNYGADVNARCEFGMSALMDCCAKGHFELVPFLLENGADANATNCNVPALWYACTQNDVPDSVVQALAERMAGGFLINCASQVAFETESASFPSGSTALHCAAICDASAQVIASLIDAGAKLDVTDDDGKTPIDRLTPTTTTDYKEKRKLMQDCCC